MKVPGNESSRPSSLRGANVPGSESSKERKFQAVNWVLLELSLQGANWPASKKARYHSAYLLPSYSVFTADTLRYDVTFTLTFGARPYWPQTISATTISSTGNEHISHMLATRNVHTMPRQVYMTSTCTSLVYNNTSSSM